MSEQTALDPSGREEKLLILLGSHLAAFFREALWVCFAALLPIAFWHALTFLGFFADNLIMQRAGAVFSLGWLMFAWIGYALLWTKRQLSSWMVTSHRVINVRYVGFFTRVLNAWTLDRVEDVAVANVGLLQSLFRYGNVVLRLSGDGEQYIAMENVTHPELVQKIIQRQQNRYVELELANERQEDLIHFVSHETKGYLSKNKAAFAAIVEGDYGEIPRALHNMAGSALTDTDRGVQTVTSILKQTDFKSGIMNLDKRVFDFKAVVNDVVTSLRSSAEKKGLVIDFAAPEGECLVQGDEAQLRGEVVRNLIDNAIHYTPSGAIHIAFSRTEDGALLVVKDSGVGITGDDMKILFTKGGHGKDSLKINPESTGFGLAAAKRVVEKHGGRIWAESEGSGKGSQFYVELPLS